MLLVGRSRGQDVLAVSKASTSVGALRGKRIGVEPGSTGGYFLMWVMSRAGLTMRDVTVVDLDAASEAGKALGEGRVDAAAGYAGELEAAVKQTGGSVLTSTADAPHLITVTLGTVASA